MNSLPEPYRAFEARLEELERKVYALEHPWEKTAAAIAEAPAAVAAHAQAAEEQGAALGGFSFPVLGKAMLGIAGAYLLRALEESGLVSRTAVAVMAIVYSLLWLAGAARSSSARWFNRIAYSCTSALVLAPMLWEVTLRFHALPAAASAAALGIFVCAATALAWRRNYGSIVWVANLGAVAVALPLSVASHQIPAFLSVLLLMVLLAEIAEAREGHASALPMAALAAAAGIWGEIFIYSGPPDTHAEYPALNAFQLIAPGIALFLIIGAGTIYKTAIKGKRITVFETILTMIAFLLAAAGILDFGPPAREALLGVVCLVLCAAGYVRSILGFRMRGRQAQLPGLCGLERGAAGGGEPVVPAAVGDHGVPGRGLGGRVRGCCAPESTRACRAWVSLSAGRRGRFGAADQPATGFRRSAPRFLQCCGMDDGGLRRAMLRCFPAAAGRPLGAAGRAHRLSVAGRCCGSRVSGGGHNGAGDARRDAGRAPPGLCAHADSVPDGAGIGLWRSPLAAKELTRTGFAALVLVAVKLVTEDLRLGHLEFIAGSIFLFALTLISVPRVARTARKESDDRLSVPPRG